MHDLHFWGKLFPEVIEMQNKYPDLYSLLESDGEARQYFDALPDYVQECIRDRSGGVNSFESLCNAADKYTRGDD